MAKDHFFIHSTTLEQREGKITTILITLKNNPSLTARVVKSNAKQISQEFMDFLVLNFFDPLQPKSCSCKSSLHVFEFIKELFIQETRFIENINDLIDCCPLLFKMINSLFNRVQLFDFLAVFLKKLLKKKYLKELKAQEYQSLNQNSQQDRASARVLEEISDLPPDWKYTSSKRYLAKFQTSEAKDLTKAFSRRRKKRKYEKLINQMMKAKHTSSKKGGEAGRMSPSVFVDQIHEKRLTNFEQNMYQELILDAESYREQLQRGTKQTDFTFILNDPRATSGSGKLFSK